jgi:hypothetical protein
MDNELSTPFTNAHVISKLMPAAESGLTIAPDSSSRYQEPPAIKAPAVSCYRPRRNGDEDAWSGEHLALLTRWKSQAFVHMYLQDKSHYYYRMIYNFLTFPVILLSAVSSTTLFTSDSTAIKIFVAVVSITCACLAALQRQIRPAEFAAQHGNAAHRYQILIHRIEACMNMMPAMRPEVRKFVDKVHNEFQVLLGTQNDPPKYVIANFEKQYGRVEGILYGDEIADMITQSLRAQASYRRMEKELAGGSASRASAASLHQHPTTTVARLFELIKLKTTAATPTTIQPCVSVPSMQRRPVATTFSADADVETGRDGTTNSLSFPVLQCPPPTPTMVMVNQH